MSQKKKVTPVVAAAKPEQKKVDLKVWTVARRKPDGFGSNFDPEPEDAGAVLRELCIRVDTLLSLGIAARLLTEETTLTLYCWQDVR